jgi:dienelactone hydrolase
MKKLLLILIFGFLISNLNAQPKTPSEYGLKSFCIKDKSLGEINFYVTKNEIKEAKPLLIILDGSGHIPIYSLLKNDDGKSQIIGTIPFRYNKLSKNYHVVLISKPGTPFIDSLEVNSYQQFLKDYKPSKEYTEKLSLEWRVSSASKVIDYLSKKINIKEKEIIAIGYSEGGHVVSKLALENKRVTKIVSIVGGGLNQFYDFITAERLKAQKGIISPEQAQSKIDSLNFKFKDIYENPNKTNKFWLGHTYKRWASFCKDIPLENMRKLDIPILVIANGNDENSPISGLDYIKLDFLRENKTNLTYKVYPNCDHWFIDQKTKNRKMGEMIEYVINWIEKE